MGAGQSTASQIPPRGLHVLRVTPLSPASETTIEPFFDFVIGFQGDTSNPSNAGMINAEELEKIVEKHEGRPLNLFVWNSKNQNTRVVPIVPSRAWSMPHLDFSEAQGQESDPDRKPSLLGLSMRMCAPETSMDNVWHVLDVLEGSPAESAGLVPYGDWIIGWSGGVLSVESDFYEVVEAHVEKPLRVYVYSYDFDNIREVVLVPNRHWGGEGLLGCVFGFGLLHRIPPLPENREPGSIPPELLESAEEYEDQQLFVPADETPEQAQERMRWEHEEWERENYARNYVHDESESAANHTPALHSHEDHTHGPDTKHAQHIQSIHDTLYHAHEDGDRHDHDTNHDGSESQDTNPPIERHPVVAPVPVRPAFRPHSFSESAGRRTPVAASRVSSFTLPRVATPTQSRPFGSLMNGINYTPRTPSGVWEHVGSPRTPGSLATPKAGGSGEDDDQDSVSVAETDFTDLSEATSTGSLTSVD